MKCFPDYSTVPRFRKVQRRICQRQSARFLPLKSSSSQNFSQRLFHPPPLTYPILAPPYFWLPIFLPYHFFALPFFCPTIFLPLFQGKPLQERLSISHVQHPGRFPREHPHDNATRLGIDLRVSPSLACNHRSRSTGCCTLFAIGLYAGYQFRYHVKNPSAVAPLADSRNSIEYGSPLKVRVESPSTAPIEIPLLDARDIDPKLIFANNSFGIAKLNQQLKRKGYELDIKPTVYSGSLQDGRKFVVPVHDVSLKPHGL